MVFNRNKRTNWDYYHSLDVDETAAGRDVQAEQQMVRGQVEEPQTPTSRIAGSVAAAFGVGLVAWIVGSLVQAFAAQATAIMAGVPVGEAQMPIAASFADFALPKVFITIVAALITFTIVYPLLMRNLEAQNALATSDDVNQHRDDQHVALNEEIWRKFDWFPDTGAHCSVQVSSMISHAMLKNKGLKKVMATQFWEKDGVDEEGDEVLSGEAKVDEEGYLVQKSLPIIDEKFAEALYDASEVERMYRRPVDATEVPYNPGNKDRGKLKGYERVADQINGDWEFPEYEVQRPAGAYLVDTEPVNTMVLAITRAGKGQTVIEPTLDMWTREKRQNNMVVNDPKGELLIKNYVPATVRGYQVVQFNLINPLKTDIYNPLAMAADAAREGDSTKCAMYIENIANVFFPLDGGEDPVWPNAANNAFKRAAYGLIDYYLEEERELRAHAERVGMDPKVLETRVDELWGYVTLYNCYQLFVQMSSKKLTHPVDRMNQPDYIDPMTGKSKDPGVVDPETGLEVEQMSDEELDSAMARAQREKVLWEDNPEMDMLSLFFNATDRMPRNQMRTLVSDANNALKAMGGAEKMMASVYGIAITAMSFFTDPTISTLTSGTPSQNVDLAGLSFPRRFGVRFSAGFIEKNHLVGLQAIWDGFADADFTEKLGSEFHHEDMVNREGWARCYIDGKFPKDVGYLRLRLQNAQTGQRIYSFYFRFQKGYTTSLDGRKYIKDAVLGEKVVKNGVLEELVKDEDGRFSVGSVTFKTKRPVGVAEEKVDDIKLQEVEEHAISQTMVRYAEKPKAVFLVTPPHLMKYAKLILILIKQLVDLNFDQSYMTKSNQKPLYKTRFMLDELGNLQSEGHGIDGFQTMLSIGLGQDQQFTIILQTLQQLRDCYGESTDKIVQGNAQPLQAKLATPQGYIRMAQVKVGDTLLTPKGTTTRVEGVFPRGTRSVYRVIRRDGSSTLACGEHLWKVRVHC